MDEDVQGVCGIWIPVGSAPNRASAGHLDFGDEVACGCLRLGRRPSTSLASRLSKTEVAGCNTGHHCRSKGGEGHGSTNGTQKRPCPPSYWKAGKDGLGTQKVQLADVVNELKDVGSRVTQPFN